MHRLCILSLILCSCVQSNKLEEILDNGSKAFQTTLTNPKHEVQVIYGEILPDTIIHHYSGVDPDAFFYPASTVKMLAAFAALERLSMDSLSLQSQIQIDSQLYHPTTLKYDSLFQGPITVENLLKKIFVYSDNQAYNILYRWLGKDFINQTHFEKGLDMRITHMLSESAFSFPQKANQYGYASLLTEGQRRSSYQQKMQLVENSLNPKNQIKGVGYIDSIGNLINEPFDFTSKNFVPLESLLGSLERVVKPDLFNKDKRYQWTENMYEEVGEIMKLKPEDLPYPIDTLADNYVKFFIYGDEDGKIPEEVEIRNKVGWAYGYLTDVAYIKDKQKGIEFFLAATIHVNENEIYNDGVYEYEEVGIPFLAELGRLVYDSYL